MRFSIILPPIESSIMIIIIVHVFSHIIERILHANPQVVDQDNLLKQAEKYCSSAGVTTI